MASHTRRNGSGPRGYFNPNLFMGKKILFLQLEWLGRRGPRGVITFSWQRVAGDDKGGGSPRLSPLHSPFPSINPAVVQLPGIPRQGSHSIKQAPWLEMGL